MTYIGYALAIGLVLYALGAFISNRQSTAHVTLKQRRVPLWFGLAALLVILVTLSACATVPQPPPEPIIETVTVEVPVDNPECPRKLLAEVGQAPDYPDTDPLLAAAANLFERVQRLMAGRDLREAREAVLIGGIAECAD